MEAKLIDLFEKQFGVSPDQIEMLPASGSARKYYRMSLGDVSYIGAYYQNIEENDLFISFSNHFHAKGLSVPVIYAVADDRLAYIQEDLGNKMLLDIVQDGRQQEMLDRKRMDLYKKSLKELLRFQLLGHEGLDYTHCVPRQAFDRRCMLWDLNYFKYCFLRLTGVGFSEEALENDFERLVARLSEVPVDSFMFRDFQSRNIMVKGDEVWFIDYQGGRRGALHYDVASLLYDAIAGIPDSQREELLDYYIQELQGYRAIEPDVFRQDYYRFVLIRLLQAMGAFGLRGLYEKKKHFIDSIHPGLKNIAVLFESGKLGQEYPELRKTIMKLVDCNLPAEV